MEYLSNKRVLHGDLACRNILLADKNVIKGKKFCPQCSWVTITNRKKVEQNQAYPVIALYMDINWAKFQNPTHSLFWENAIWICVVKSLHGELRFTIFGHFAIFHPLNQARAEFDINRTWSLWKNLSFATKKLKIGQLS